MSSFTSNDTTHYENVNSQTVHMTTALRMVRLYGETPPSYKQMMADFGCSRATAYRWRRAFIASLPMAARVEHENKPHPNPPDMTGVVRSMTPNAIRKREAAARRRASHALIFGNDRA